MLYDEPMQQTAATGIRVGVVGLGAMGQGMAASLRRAGFELRVFDLRPEVAQAFAQQGGIACASLPELAAASQVDMARASKFPLPLSATAHQMFMQASSAGFAREDDSAVINIFPGIVLPRATGD